MIFHHIIPLITTVKDDDGARRIIFFDTRDQYLKFKMISTKKWKKRLGIVGAGIFWLLFIIGIVAYIFPNVLSQTLLTSYGAVATVVILFLASGFFAYKLLNKIAVGLANSQDTRIVFMPSEYLHDQILRLFCHFALLLLVMIFSLLAMIVFSSEMIVLGIAIVDLIAFLPVTFIFWLSFFQPIFTEINVCHTLMKEDKQ